MYSKLSKALLSVVLSLNILPCITVYAIENGLDIEDANDAFDDMKDKFENEQDNYGNITIWDGDDIYKQYQRGIRDSINIMDKQYNTKKNEFQKKEYEGYGTVEDLDDYISSKVNKETNKLKNNFSNDLEEAEDFLSKFGEQQVKVAELQEANGQNTALSKVNKEKYMNLLNGFKESNKSSNSISGDIGCYYKEKWNINTNAGPTTWDEYYINNEEYKDKWNVGTGILVNGDVLTNVANAASNFMSGLNESKNRYNTSVENYTDECGRVFSITSNTNTSVENPLYSNITGKEVRKKLNELNTNKKTYTSELARQEQAKSLDTTTKTEFNKYINDYGNSIRDKFMNVTAASKTQK